MSDEIYINVDGLCNAEEFKAFFATRYKRSVKRFISEEGLNVILVSKINVEKGELCGKENYA